MSKEKTIKIYVENGAVIDIINIPPNYSCEVIDYDVTEEDEDEDDYGLLRQNVFGAGRKEYLKSEGEK